MSVSLTVFQLHQRGSSRGSSWQGGGTVTGTFDRRHGRVCGDRGQQRRAEIWTFRLSLTNERQDVCQLSRAQQYKIELLHHATLSQTAVTQIHYSILRISDQYQFYKDFYSILSLGPITVHHLKPSTPTPSEVWQQR